MKFTFRYLLAFETANGKLNVAEFGNYEEYKEFESELNTQGLPSKLINAREFKSPDYKNANYLDLK